MIGQVAWDDQLKKLVLSIDGKVAITSRNLGYIKRAVKAGWDQAKSLGITEFTVVSTGPTAQAIEAPVPVSTPEPQTELKPIFGALINTQEILGKLAVPPPGKRGRGRPRKPKHVIGITNHRESNDTQYKNVPASMQERLVREYKALNGGIRERVLALGDRHGLTYRQVFEVVNP